MDNINFDYMMKMLSNMDKKELEMRMSQVSKMFENKSPEEVFKQISNNNKSKTTNNNGLSALRNALDSNSSGIDIANAVYQIAKS